MDASNISELRRHVDEVIHSSTKKDAQPLSRSLELYASGLKVNMDLYYAGKLGEVVRYAKEASGNFRDKEHWINQLERCWSTFKHGVEYPS